MPLTRSKNKNAFRSPGISSANYFQSSSTPKGFHPPSYYAAAAGLTHQHPEDDKSGETPTRRTTAADQSVAEFHDVFVPASMPTAQLPPSSSASSTEPGLVSRMSFLNRRLSKANGTSSKSSKRKSQLADLPLVEAQLVPSLRDTIDRMTNSPNSQAQTPVIFPYTSQQNFHDPLPSSSQHPPLPSTPPTRQCPSIKTAPTTPTSIPRFPNVLESSRIPTPVTMTKTRSNLKPALKNVNASTNASTSGQGGQSSPTKASPSRSLRSVRGILGRKTPQIPSEHAQSDITRVQTGNVNAPVIGAGRLARERSHTDPGHVSRIPSRSPHVQATRRVPPPVSTFSTPGQEPRVVRLNRGYAAISNSSGSEQSLQDDRGRALFVTNAVIVPSSSSSSEEVEPCQLSPYVRVKHPAWSSQMLQRTQPFGGRSAQSGVGLGFGTPGTMGNSHSNATPHIGSGMPDGDIESEYNSDPGDEDAGPLISSSTSSAHLRSLVLNRQILRSPDLSRNSSASSRDALPNPWNSSEGDQRRRELIELVNGIDQGSLGSAQACEYDDSLSDDEYVGEQGLAISPSDEFGNIMDITLKAGDENGSFPRRRSPGAGQATPRQTPSAPISMAFSGDNPEYSSPRNLSGTIARDQMTEVHRNDKGDEFSPLSEYSGDEDAHHKATSPSAQRIRQSPLARDCPLFGDIREGDRSLSSRESSARAPTASVALPPSTRLHSSDSRRPSGSTHRTSREMLGRATGSPAPNSDGAHSSGGTQSLDRVRERKGMQRSPAPIRDTTLPHADSSSSIESLLWQHEDQEISVDAEAIFEQLRVGRERLPAPNETSSVHSQRQVKEPKSQTKYPSKTSSPRDTPNSLPQTTTGTPNSRDVAGVYEGTNTIQETRYDARSSQAFEPEQRTWLSTISSSAYHSLLDRYGEVEIKRQQIIWDLCETERTFVRRLQTFVRLFIRPLRMKDSVTWLAGVPMEVARLFDWLEDIINLHAQISSALRAVVSEQYPIVMRIAGRVRSFVSRLEVHQPYVVRLESTTLLIKRLSGESRSDFGEWIRIQQEQDECHGWSVEGFLVEPVNRLVDYPIHFKRLLDVTPQDHPDYLATFSLLNCTETVIRVMREVKLQEEEYELVKDRLRHIKGSPATLQLVHRSRRLLARGRLDRDTSRFNTRTATAGGEAQDHRHSIQAAGVRQSRLISAIQSRAIRSDSIRTTSESSNSVESHFSDDLQTKPYSSDFVQRSTSASSLGPKTVWERQSTASRNAHTILESREMSLYTLVFSDLVLLASPIFDTTGQNDRTMQVDSWGLLEGIGISRVLQVREDSGQIVLDLLPVDLENIATGRIPDSGQVIKLTLSVPSTSSSGVQLDTPNLSRLRHNWVSAFQECAEYTVRALSFPTQSGKLAAPIPGLGWDGDPRSSVSAILESGFPLPKSPSTQMEENGADAAQQEREARGWWALRFQQVLREVQRGYTGALLTPSTPTPGGDTANSKRRASQPRVLKLSSLSSSESILTRLP